MSILSEWRQQLSRFNGNITLILWTSVLFQMGMGMFWVMYNLYVVSAGHDQEVVGRVVGLTSLASAISLIPAGLLSDRFGRKRMIIIGGLITSFTLFLRAVFETESSLLAAGFIEGLFASLVQVSFFPFLAEQSKREQQIHLFSLLSAAGLFAGMLGNLIGGFLADFFHFSLGFPEKISLRYALIIGAGMVTLALIPLLRIKEGRKNAAGSAVKGPQGKKEGGLRRFSRLFAHHHSYRIIFLYAGAEIFIGFGAGLVIPYLNLYFSDRFSASNALIGTIVSLGQLATGVATLIGPMVVKRMGEVGAVIFFQLTSIPFLLITGFATNLIPASVGYLIRQALMNAAGPIQISIMLTKVEDSMKGLANSVSQTIFTLGWALMGPVSTSIVARNGSYWGYSYVFLITSVLYVLGALYFYYFFGRKGDRLAEKSEVSV